MKTYRDYYHRSPLKLLINISFFWLALLSKIFPKKKGLYLFGSMNGYAVADNSKYMYNNINNINNINKYFLTKNINIIDTPLDDGNYPIYAYSLQGIWLQLTAERVYFTHGIFDFFPPLIWGSEKHNLWHGVPIKDIGVLHDWGKNSTSIRNFKIIFYRIFEFSYYMSCDYVYCSFIDKFSDYNKYFLVSRPVIINERQARNVFSINTVQKRKILWAPTYREHHRERDDIDIFIKKIGLLSSSVQELLNQCNIELVIRLHPIDKEVFNFKSLPSHYIEDTSLDLYSSIKQYSAVITDYSSIYYDCLEIGIPCFRVTPDLDEYMKETGLSISYYNECQIEHKKTIHQALEEIIDLDNL